MQAIGFASPADLALGSFIGNTTTFSGSVSYLPATAFRFVYGPDNAVSADFGPGSYMGFRFGNGTDWNYGWLEVKWDAGANTFEILSGAYESTPNVGILAGSVAIPEPRSAVALGMLALGGAAVRRYRKSRRERAVSESAATVLVGRNS